MRLASGGIQHETNTFSTTPTTLADFIRYSQLGPQLEGGNAIIERYAGTGSIHGGYIDGAQATGIELIPLLTATACPSGVVAQQAFDTMLGWFLERLEKVLPVDGVLLDLHGAMVTESYQDAEGEFIDGVRKLVGQDMPIVVTLDLHANITERMADLADVIIGFDTYPHIDMNERGREAIELLARIVSGQVSPRQAFRKLPLLTMPPMQCTLREPMQSLMQQVHQLEARPDILTATVAMGFPFADIHHLGVSVLVTADGNQELAGAKADELANTVWNLREDLQPQLTKIEDVMEFVDKHPNERLTIFADGSDNPGLGAPCDGTVALQAMIDANFKSGLVGVLFDPETAGQAHAAGVGSMIQVRLGGKTDNRHGDPVQGKALVKTLSNGDFTYRGPMFQGVKDSLGPSATIVVGGVEVVVSSERRQCLDREMLRVAGIELSNHRLLVIKSAVHFRADFDSVAAHIFDADTPGTNRPDFNAYEFKRLRRPIYPLDQDVSWS